MKVSFLMGLMVFAVNSYGGFATHYRGQMDCGVAEDWPQENFTSPTGTLCSVDLKLSPDGYDQYNRLIGDVEFTVSDMQFIGTYIETDGQIYLDFHNKKYQHYRGAKRQRWADGRTSIEFTAGSRRVRLFDR